MDRRSALKRAVLGGGAIALGWKPDIPSFESLKLKLKAAEGEAYWELIKSEFRFRKGMYYFNNASLGGSPISVIDATDKFRRMLDGYPSKYMWGDWSDEKREVREKMATLLNADHDEVALVHNTTEGMNLIASSLDLDKGDEVIVGNHEHPTARIPWQYYQEQGRGVTIVRPELPLYPTSPGDILDVYAKAITKKTRAISMVHMTNTNGMILPVKQICAMAREKGILTAVDGAQSMAAIKCDVKDLGCDYFAASAHKWLFSPKGMGVLYAHAESPEIKPLIANRRYKSKTMIRVEDYNTRNLPELLGTGTALDFHNMIGSEKVIARMGELRAYFESAISNVPDLIVHTPKAGVLSHQILAVQKTGMSASNLKNALFDDHNIDVRWMGSHKMDGVRISLAIYNTKADIDQLAAALQAVSGDE